MGLGGSRETHTQTSLLFLCWVLLALAGPSGLEVTGLEGGISQLSTLWVPVSPADPVLEVLHHAPTGAGARGPRSQLRAGPLGQRVNMGAPQWSHLPLPWQESSHSPYPHALKSGQGSQGSESTQRPQ